MQCQRFETKFYEAPRFHIFTETITLAQDSPIALCYVRYFCFSSECVTFELLWPCMVLLKSTCFRDDLWEKEWRMLIVIS